MNQMNPQNMNPMNTQEGNPLLTKETLKKMRPMKDVLYLVVHCTATRPSQTLSVADLDRIHRARGWAMIGYHWYITRDGEIHEGRPEQFEGSHVRHYNQHAIGVCYEGGVNEKGKAEDTRTPAQKAALHFLLQDLKSSYPQAQIVGHRDFPNVRKDCPSFDAKAEYANIDRPKFY